ncbi:hypothetical protein DL93DRAFT_2033305, partial [Clavulina sp. PMI_390]
TWSTSPHVLIVEDDIVSRRIVGRLLELSGCEIDVAADGFGAVSLMEGNRSTDGKNRNKFDLVLMDIVLPKMDGVSATTLIRQFDVNTPIISMTSKSRPDEVSTYFS